MNFYAGGKWQPIVIDDLLPVDVQGHLVNAKPSKISQGWWLPLLEKAYAKLNVNYEQLD